MAETTDLAERFLTAHEALDSATVAEICGRLTRAKDERKEVADKLLQIIGESDVRRAEVAVNLLTLSGMALDVDFCDRLIVVAEKLFTKEVLSELAADEKLRLKGPRPRQRMSPGLRLLRSVIRAAARTGGAKAAGFVAGIEGDVATTPLAALVAKWKVVD